MPDGRVSGRGLVGEGNAILMVLQCLRVEDTTDKIDRLRRIEPSDWNRIHTAALRSGLAPLLYSVLKPLGTDSGVPLHIRDLLREACLRSAARNMRLYAGLSKVLKALGEADISVIPLKGAYLAEAVYGNIALRPMGDVDLLVRQEDLGKSVEVLGHSGYRAECSPQPGDVLLTRQHYPPLISESGLSIEIHWTLAVMERLAQAEPGDVWGRARPGRIAGVEVLTLCAEDLLIHLCTHSALNHGLERQHRCLLDAARVMGAYGDRIDWSLLKSIARTWGVERSVYLMLSLAGDCTGVSAPEDFMTSIRPAHGAGAMLETGRKILFDHSASFSAETMARIMESPSFMHRCRLLLGRFFLPKAEIGVIYGIPSDSSRIYLCYLMRWGDVIRRHFRKVLGIVFGNKDAAEALQASRARNALVDWLQGRDDDPGGSGAKTA